MSVDGLGLERVPKLRCFLTENEEDVVWLCEGSDKDVFAALDENAGMGELWETEETPEEHGYTLIGEDAPSCNWCLRKHEPKSAG